MSALPVRHVKHVATSNQNWVVTVSRVNAAGWLSGLSGLRDSGVTPVRTLSARALLHSLHESAGGPSRTGLRLTARWAQVNAVGTLTVIGASFLRATAPLGAPMSFAVAARLRFSGGLAECGLRVVVTPLGGSSVSYDSRIDASAAQSTGAAATPNGGRPQQQLGHPALRQGDGRAVPWMRRR